MNDIKNKDIITTFYAAFQKKDSVTMASCYHADAVFNDPVFSELSHDEVVAMWAMLCARGENLVINFKEPQLRGDQYIVHWTADYEFGKKRKKVLNQITAYIICKDGKIFKHIDEFSFYKWAIQAFGPFAYVYAWMPYFKNKVKASAMKSLIKYMNSHTKTLYNANT